MAQILIVDDDELVADLASDMLIHAGHACGWVESGEQALALLKWRRPDLILLDQDMPGMRGQDLLSHLRGSEEFYDLPVIMLTAITGTADENRALYHGAQAYIRKPFDQKILRREVNAVLDARANREGHTDLRSWLAINSGQTADKTPTSQSSGMNRRAVC